MKKANIYYNGNVNIKKAGVKSKMTREQQKEYRRCRKDPVYFCRNYVKIISLNEGLVHFDMWDFQERMVQTFHENRFVINLLPRQMGKALPLDTQIPTPDGWSTVGDLKVGDYIFDRDGKPTQVTYKSDVYTNRKCYKFVLDNGDEIVSDELHLWNVHHADWGSQEKTLETKDVLKKFNTSNSRPYIRINDPIQLPEKELSIDPYTLGVWLGDGSSYHGCIYGEKSDLNEILSYIPYETVSLTEQKTSWCARIDSLHTGIKSLGVYKSKHIPSDYLRASIDQRLELLRGLMDTDGHCEKSGRCEFYQKDSVLVEQVGELLSSLGIKWRSRYKEIEGLRYYTLSFCTTFDVFKLKRKLIRQSECKQHPKNKRLYISDIVEVESVPTQCIEVDNPDHLFLCGKTMVPTHNTITVAAYLLHHAIFNKHKSIGILANKAATAREILSRMQRMLENLPFFLQPGVVEYNKGSVEFGNGSSIMAAATSSDSIRGFSFNVVYLDEFAFVEDADTFYTSTYPVISSGDNTKVLITSTPNGMNLFYKLWEDARTNKNDYVPVQVHWSENPNRDEKWKETTLRNIGKKQFAQEYECAFHGSSGTLISGEKLAAMTWAEPIKESEHIKVYEEPQPTHSYLVTVDVSEGVGGDYSVVNVTDITKEPYKQVCVFRDNLTAVMVLPEIVERLAKQYNDAFVLVETNSVGAQVSNILYHDYEYENMIVTATKHQENFVSGGFSSTAEIGLRMTKKSKRIGCTNIKALIENDIYQVMDFQTICELQTFVKKGQSYEAEDEKHDDIVMTLVALGWLSTQDYFKDLMDVDHRKAVLERQIQALEDDCGPVGFFNDAGLDELNSDDGPDFSAPMFG